MCPCGQPARAVLIKQLGEVPTCRTAEQYRAEVGAQVRHVGILRSGGQSGAR